MAEGAQHLAAPDDLGVPNPSADQPQSVLPPDAGGTGHCPRRQRRARDGGDPATDIRGRDGKRLLGSHSHRTDIRASRYGELSHCHDTQCDSPPGYSSAAFLHIWFSFPFSKIDTVFPIRIGRHKR